MSISDQHLICHFNNVFISSHAWADWWSKRAKHWSLAAFWFTRGEQWHSCFTFFWVQADVIEILPAGFFFMWRTLGVMYSTNGRGGGIPQGEQGISFIWRLPSCLLHVFHKVLRFWRESKNRFYPASSSHLKFITNLSTAELSPPKRGRRQRGRKSLLNVV